MINISNENTKWTKGSVPVGRGDFVYVDTETGEGVDKICSLLQRFVSYQSSKVKFPSSTPEDVAQDLYVLALEAMPSYNPDKNANILTFLQSHIKKRLINKCKFVSEKKRRATYINSNAYKIRCPNCRGFSTAQGPVESCPKCGHSGREGKWKKYNIPVLPIFFTCIEDKLPEEVNDLTEAFSDLQTIASLLGETAETVDQVVQIKLDFMKLFDRLDETNKKIVQMILAGYAYKDIATEVGLSEKATYARVAKIISRENHQ